MNRIRELRMQRARAIPASYTRTALAARLGVSENTLARWEQGNMVPRLRMALKLAHELGVTVEELGIGR